MKKAGFLVLLAFCFTTFCYAQEQEKKKVALYVSGEISDANKKIVSSKAVSRISRSTEYVAVERTEAFLNALSKEQDYQLSGEVRDEQIVALSKRFGAKYVAVLEVSETEDNTCFISARLINVESGLVIKSADGNRLIKTTDDLVALANNVAYRLVSRNSK